MKSWLVYSGGPGPRKLLEILGLQKLRQTTSQVLPEWSVQTQKIYNSYDIWYSCIFYQISLYVELFTMYYGTMLQFLHIKIYIYTYVPRSWPAPPLLPRMIRNAHYGRGQHALLERSSSQSIAMQLWWLYIKMMIAYWWNNLIWEMKLED